jgi:uncharacterized Zn finger protein
MGSEYWEYKASRPRKVKNGIKSRSRKGNIGSTWWSESWLKILESYGSGWSSNRLKRGMKYARMGQVINFKLSKGSISASVQGSRSKPYTVTVSVKMLNDKQWKIAIKAMSNQVIYAAKLLGGEMPKDIEKVFESSARLFPSKADFKSSCTCPDIANPCKHICAVCYIIAEEFDRNPFMIFELRGRSREDILKSLRHDNGDSDDTGSSYTTEETRYQLNEKHGKSDNNDIGPDVYRPLEDLVSSFWHAGKNYRLDISMKPATLNAAIIKRLGEPSFWRLQKNFVDIMEEIYAKVSNIALKKAYSK